MHDVGAWHIIDDAAIAIDAGHIVWLGRDSDCPYQSQHSLDCQGFLLSPGLIDCHTHLVYAGDRSKDFSKRLAGESYQAIAAEGGGINETVTATRAASFDSLLQSSLKRGQKLLASGVTTVEIKSGYGLDKDTELKQLRVAKALAQQLPLNVKTTFLGAHCQPADFNGQPKDYLDYLISQVFPKLLKEDLADAVDIFCASSGFDLHLTEYYLQQAKAAGFAIKCHAEQLEALGASKITASMGALSVDHIEYTTADDLITLAEQGTVAVLLPSAYYFLQAKQKPPIAALREKGIAMSIATDHNPGTSPTLSLTLCMNMACLLFGLTPLEAWQGVTCQAAKALGIFAKTGSLAVGKTADIAVWPVERPETITYAMGEIQPVVVIQGGRCVINALN